jgi:uncharacterized protein
MKPCLADVNTVLPLLVRDHEHYKPAQKWFERLEAGEAGLCRHVQLGVIRLLGNRHIMGGLATPAGTGWRMLEELLADERISFVGEPELLDSVFPRFLNMPVPAAKLVSDAYLAAFAMASSRRMVTFDAGFRQFKGLEVEILPR